MVSVGPATISNMIGGLLMAGLGLWVLTLKPRRTANTRFAFFAVPFGLAFIPSNIALILGIAVDPMAYIAAALFGTTAVGLTGLVARFPEPMTREDLRPAGPARGGDCTTGSTGDGRSP